MKPKWFLVLTAVAGVVFATIVIRFFNTVSQRSVVDAIIFSAYIVGGVVLAFAPFDRKRRRSRWARGLFALSALLLIFVGVAELLRHYSIWVLSPVHEHGLSSTLDALRGIVMGLFLALIFSGELAGERVSRDHQA